MYDDSGNRVRKDVTGSPSTEYIYFGGNPIAEHDVTRGTWSDYIYANGKRAPVAARRGVESTSAQLGFHR